MRVCLLHDLFRADLFGQGGQNHTTAMWEQVLAPVLASLGHSLFRPAAFIADDPPALRAFAAAHALDHGVASWLRLYSGPATLPLVADLLARQVLEAEGPVDLVLGWELSPNIMRALAALGLPAIEFNLDPVRFCPDLFLRARSNDPAIARGLAGYAVPDAVPRARAAEIAATLPPPAQPDAVLFAGQVADDSSLIVEGAFARAADYAPALTEPGLALLLKPHPHGVPHSDISSLHEICPASQIVPDNIYSLLAAPFVRRVVTLSSSVAAEAALFGKPALRLIVPDQAPERLPEFGVYHRLDRRFLSAACWAGLLGGTLTAAPAPPAISRLFSRAWGRTPGPSALPSRRLPAGAVRHFGAGSDGLIHQGFGWATPGADTTEIEGAFATLLLSADTPRIALACRAGSPLALAITVRPTGASTTPTLPAGESGIMLDVPAAVPIELTLRPQGRFELLRLAAPA